MEYPAGTLITADSDEYTITGTLVDGENDFEGEFRVRCDSDGRVLTLFGWMFETETH
jgi:hypothetical protein